MTRVGRLEDLPVGKPVLRTFGYKSDDAYAAVSEVHDVFVIRRSDTDVTVFSPICTHLGCHGEWDSASGRFVCPCHGSVFSADGRVLGGPAPRPFDTLPHRIEDGVLLVEWQRFEPGILQRVQV
jgi:Rieske Fe-S protein